MLTAGREHDSILISVADTGIGIPQEEQAEVFEMFSQVSANMGRAQGGLGIGLSLVRSLVEMHGGTITVNSLGPGRGTTFIVTLPSPADCGPNEFLVKDALSKNEPTATPGLHVLVADDNVDAASMLSSLLQATGHTTESVHDGLTAVERIIAVKPELAILDIGMPGMNGYEVAEKIRATPGMEEVVLIALTGWGSDNDRNRSRKAGFDAHLIKPIGLADLNELITKVTNKTI